MDKKDNGSSVIYGKKNLWFCNMLTCYLVLWPGSCSKLSCFQRPSDCPFLKIFYPVNVKELVKFVWTLVTTQHEWVNNFIFLLKGN